MARHRFHQASELDLASDSWGRPGRPHPSDGGHRASTGPHDRAGTMAETAQDPGVLLPLPSPLQPSELRSNGSCASHHVPGVAGAYELTWARYLSAETAPHDITVMPSDAAGRAWEPCASVLKVGCAKACSHSLLICSDTQ